MDKEKARELALKQMALGKLREQEEDLRQELITLESNQKGKSVYIISCVLAGVFLYFILLIIGISIFECGTLYRVYTYFLDWTLFLSFSFIGLCFPIYKYHKRNKLNDEKIAATRKALHENHQKMMQLWNE